MHWTQSEIISNLEVLSVFPTMRWQQMKIIFFVNIFRKRVSKCVASFGLRCLPPRKRRKVRLNLGDLRWFCLLFSMNKRIAGSIPSRAAFCILFVCCCMNQCRFSAILWRMQLILCVDQLQSEQIFHYIHVCEVISA